MPVYNKNIKLVLNYVVGPLVFCLLIFSIYKQVNAQTNWNESLHRMLEALQTRGGWKIYAVFLLMIANWGIEAKKWQIVVSRVQTITWWQSFQATLTGTTLAFFTPNRMGEYVGRVLYIEDGNRIKAASLTIVSSLAQLLVTLFLGVAGIAMLRTGSIQAGLDLPEEAIWIDLVGYGALAVSAFLALLYFRFSWIIRWVEKIPRLDKYSDYLRVLDNFNATTLGRLLSLSLLRYVVFVLQYYWLFNVFEVGLSAWQVFWSMTIVFLFLAIIPTIALLTELGVRWKTSIAVLQLFSSNLVGILATSLSIWVINLVIPALLGSLLILNIRLFRNKNGKSDRK